MSNLLSDAEERLPLIFPNVAHPSVEVRGQVDSMSSFGSTVIADRAVVHVLPWPEVLSLKDPLILCSLLLPFGIGRIRPTGMKVRTGKAHQRLLGNWASISATSGSSVGSHSGRP